MEQELVRAEGVDALLDRLQHDRVVQIEAIPTGRRLVLSAIERRLGRRSLSLTVPRGADRPAYTLLQLAARCGVVDEVAESLARRDFATAISRLEPLLGDRVLLINNIGLLDPSRNGMTTDRWDLDRIVRDDLHELWEMIGGLRRVEADERLRSATRPLFTTSENLTPLWHAFDQEPDRFLLGLAHRQVTGADPSSLSQLDQQTMIEEIRGALPLSVVELIDILTVFDRLVPTEFFDAMVRQHPALLAAQHLAKAAGLVEEADDELRVLPALTRHWAVEPNRQRHLQHQWAQTLRTLTPEPRAVLEAHRNFAAAGHIQEAMEFARFGTASLLEAARSASLSQRWHDAIEGYGAALTLSETGSIPPTTRAYARHYLHYNRYRASVESLPDTRNGYEQALRDWPTNAFFWSRTIRCNVYLGEPLRALRLLRTAYANVPEHPLRDSFLRTRTADKLAHRGQWLAALWVMGSAPVVGNFSSCQAEIQQSFVQGVLVDRVFAEGVGVVTLEPRQTLRIYPIGEGRWGASVGAFTAEGADRIAALDELVAKMMAVRSELSIVRDHPELEVLLQRLGRTGTPEARVTPQQVADEARRLYPHLAAAWFVRRIRDEHHGAVLDAAAAVLVAFDEQALDPVLEALDDSTLSADARRTLLDALVGLPIHQAPEARVRSIIDAARRWGGDEAELADEIAQRI